MGDVHLDVVFAGPFLGCHQGVVPNPVESIAPRFGDINCSARLVSTKRHPLARALDTAVSVNRWAYTADVAVVLGYTNRAFAQADLALRIAKRRGLATILWLHSGDLVNFARTSPKWFARVVARADLCAAPTTFLTALAEPFARHTMVIPNAIAPALARRSAAPPGSAPRLLWMRTFHEWYRPHVAIDILAQLRVTHPDATLTMAGQDEGLYDSVVQYCSQRGQRAHVHFAGFISGKQKQHALTNHDFYLHTNSVDNAPVSVLEAMGSGLVVVAADVGGVRHLVGESAVFTPNAQPQEYVREIVRLCNDPHEFESRAQHGQALHARFAWEYVAPIWREAFDLVIRPGQPAALIGQR